MKKSDLQSGMIVETRDGNKLLLVKNTSNGDIFINANGWNKLEYYNDDLTNNECRDFDIMKVYNGKSGGLTYMLNESPLIWERREMPTLTDAEKTILESLNKKYTYIARDESNELVVYTYKPNKGSGIWWSGTNYYELSAFAHLFQFVKWEDDEPYKIEDLIKGC